MPRPVRLAEFDAITQRLDEEWMQQIARNATQNSWGYLSDTRYLPHDRDTLLVILPSRYYAPVESARSPYQQEAQDAFAERRVRSIK